MNNFLNKQVDNNEEPRTKAWPEVVQHLRCDTNAHIVHCTHFIVHNTLSNLTWKAENLICLPTGQQFDPVIT